MHLNILPEYLLIQDHIEYVDKHEYLQMVLLPTALEKNILADLVQMPGRVLPYFSKVGKFCGDDPPFVRYSI